MEICVNNQVDMKNNAEGISSEPVRVLHILQRMEAGGTQALLMNIYRKIDRTKLQFDFLVEYSEKQFYDDEITAMGGHVYYTSIREDYNVFKFRHQLKKFFKEHKEYKVVHVHAYTIGFLCLDIIKKAGIPVRIAHSHNNETVHDAKWLIKLCMQKLYTINATDLFACSQEAGEYLFKNKKFKVLKNAIDSSRFIADNDKRQVARHELGIENNFVVGHVGRLHPQKNHTFLLEVFNEIKKLRADAVLILVGSGPLKEEIENKVRSLGLEKDVVFLGNRKDMDYIYQATDVCIFPSLFEGLGIVAIEAQAAGIPVICSDGFPKEACVTPLYKKMELSKSPILWAKAAIGMAENEYCHKNMKKYIVKSGFDMDETAVKMQSYYLEKSGIKS